MPFAILVLQNTQVVILLTFELELLFIFYTKTCIRDLKNIYLMKVFQWPHLVQ